MSKTEQSVDLSVIIPVYNAERYIVDCVSSILNTGIESMEVILVDDGSMDHSYEKCTMLAQGDTRVLLFSKANRGSSSARNYGLERAKGKYISFIDSDDYVDSVKYRTALNETISKNADIGCFGLRSEKKEEYVIRNNACDNNWQLFIKYPVYMHSVCNKFFKRDLLDSIRFDEDLTFCEDMLFCGKAFLNTDNYVFIDECVYTYRENDNSVTHIAFSEKKIRDDIEAAERLIAYSGQLERCDQKDLYKLAAFRHQIAGVRYLTEPKLFSIEKYRACVIDKAAYRDLPLLRYRILCWSANHGFSVIPWAFITIKKMRDE